MRTFLRRLCHAVRRDQMDAELREEIDFHRAMKQRELEAAGHTPADAAHAAVRALGSQALAREQARDVWVWPWLRDAAADVRDAVRSLKRTPGLAAAVVALIALLIGGNATVFSVIHGILTKPAPGVLGDRLVTIDLIVNGRPFDGGNSYSNFVDYAAQSTTIHPMDVADYEHFTLTVPAGSYAIRGDLVSGSYFETLGVRPISGRVLSDLDERASESALPAVISERLWRRQFVGAADVVGRPIALNGHAATIIGVAPPRFNGAVLGESSDVWVPLVPYARVHRTENSLRDRTHMGMWVFGQIAPHRSLADARSEFALISHRVQAAHPDTNQGQLAVPIPYAAIATGSLLFRQGDRLLAIFAVVTALTVLIVCANVANLMLARTTVRQRELALRQSLGASRGRLVRMLLVEGLVMSLVAWLAACVSAVAVSKLLVLLLPTDPSGATLNWDFAPDWTVAGYAMVLALLSVMAFTLAPAVRVWRQNVLPHLKAGEHGIIQGRSALSNVLVVAQLAFSILLLTSAGLAARSLASMSRLDLGFDTAHLLLASVNTAGSAATPEANRLLLARIQERVRAMPGIESVSHVRWISGSGGEPIRLRLSDTPIRVTQNFIGPEYLRVFGTPPLAGREFAAREPSHVNPGAIINQHLANTLWPGQSPIGRVMLVGLESTPVEIVGVSPDAFFTGFMRNPHPDFVFRSAFEEPGDPGERTFYIRYAGSIETATAAFSRALRETDAHVPIAAMYTMEANLQTQRWPVLAISILLVMFASGSLLIAVTGQYAIVAFSTRRRTRDFGIRLALGASSHRIVSSVLSEGFRVTMAGLLAGFALSLIASRALRSVLYGITPTDRPTYAAVAVVLLASSLMACYIPARRATRIDPLAALRTE